MGYVQEVAQGLRSVLNLHCSSAPPADNNNNNATCDPSPAVSARFLPGRTCYVYDLNEDFGLGVPTTVSRSKTEYEQQKYKYLRQSATEDAAILERIAGVLAYVASGRQKTTSTGTSTRPRQRRKQRAAGEALPGAPGTAEGVGEGDDDGDIFSDAGTDLGDTDEDEGGGGVAEGPSLPAKADDGRPAGYFGVEGGANGVADGGVEQAEEAEKYTYRDLEDDEDRELRDFRRRKHGAGLGEGGRWHEIMEGDGEDAYGDLYPGLDGGNFDGSDDEDGAKLRKEAEEGEEAGKSNKRAKQQKDGKLNSEYGKMKMLFKEKGFGNESAFAEASGEDQEEGTKKKGKKKKKATDADPTFMPRQKRLRL